MVTARLIWRGPPPYTAFRFGTSCPSVCTAEPSERTCAPSGSFPLRRATEAARECGSSCAGPARISSRRQGYGRSAAPHESSPPSPHARMPPECAVRAPRRAVRRVRRVGTRSQDCPTRSPWRRRCNSSMPHPGAGLYSAAAPRANCSPGARRSSKRFIRSLRGVGARGRRARLRPLLPEGLRRQAGARAAAT